jgi:GGDEF domain-containing protein
MALSQEHRTKLNSVIHAMKMAGEAEGDIRAAVRQFKTKYDVPAMPTPVVSPAPSPLREPEARVTPTSTVLPPPPGMALTPFPKSDEAMVSALASEKPLTRESLVAGVEPEQYRPTARVEFMTPAQIEGGHPPRPTRMGVDVPEEGAGRWKPTPTEYGVAAVTVEPPTPLPERVAKGWGMGVAGMIEGAGGVLQMAGETLEDAKKTFIDYKYEKSPTETERNWVRNMGSAIKEQGKELKEFYEIPDPDYIYQLAGGAASMGTFLIPGLGVQAGVGRLVTVAPKLAAWLGISISSFLEASVESGRQYNEALERGLSEEEARNRGVKNFWSNIGLLVATNKASGIFDKMGSGARRLASSSLMEFSQEGGQEIISNILNEDPALKGAFTAGTIGAVMGGGVSTLQTTSEQMEIGKAEQALEGRTDAESQRILAELGNEQVPADQRVQLAQRVTKEIPVETIAEEDQPKLTPEQQKRKDDIARISDRIAVIEGDIQGAKNPEKIRKRMVDQGFLGAYGVTSKPDMIDAAEEFDAAGIPYTIEASDGGNWKKVNDIEGTHANADKVFKSVYGDIWATRIKEAGGIPFRLGGDELGVLWPGMTPEQARPIREQIETEMRQKRDELGYRDVSHARHGLPTGALHTDYYLIQSIPGKFSELLDKADAEVSIIKQQNDIDMARELGYTYNEEAEKYEFTGKVAPTPDTVKPAARKADQVAPPADTGVRPGDTGTTEKAPTPDRPALEPDLGLEKRPPQQQPITPESASEPAQTDENQAEETEIPADEAGAMTLPDPSSWKRFLARIKGIFSTKKAYETLGAPETGRAMSALFSRYNMGNEKALEYAKRAFKDLPRDEAQRHLFFTITNPKHLNRQEAQAELTAEEQAQIKESAARIRKDMEQWGARLKAAGRLQELWPTSAINRNKQRIQDLHEEIGEIQGEKWKPTRPIKVTGEQTYKAAGEQIVRQRKTEISKREKEMAQLEADNTTLEGLSYMHLPVRMWLGDMYTNDPDGFRTLLSGSFRGIKGRKTIDPWSLVEARVLYPQKVNAGDALAYYIRYVEQQEAQAAVRDAATKEGLVKDESDAPADWVEIGSRFPAFKGKKVNPAFAEMLASNFERGTASTSLWRKGWSLAKMAQFFNPIIMPMYDTYQGAIATQMRFARPKYVKKALNSVLKKDNDYWEAYDNNLFSTPYANPLSSFKKDLDAIRKNPESFATDPMNALENMLKEEGRQLKKKPIQTILKNLTTDIYNASWNTAWTGDKVIRMMTYHNLKARGYSSQQAAELAAQAHADYADVPAATRHAANIVFFTPTFQVSMLKWFASMYSAPFRVPVRLAKQAIGKGDKTKLARDLILTQSAATMTAFWYARDYVMTALLGWEREEFNRKYKKLVKYYDPKIKKMQQKEVVLTLSDPTNIPMKWYYTFIKNKPGMTKSEQIAKYGRYWLHPILKIGADLKDNKKPDGSMIMNPFHSGPRQLLDAGKYIGRNVFRLYGDLLAEDNETKADAFRVLRLSKDHWANQLFRPIAFAYLRDPEVERIKFQVDDLYNKFIKTLRDKPPTSRQELERVEKMFEKQMGEMEDRLKDLEMRKYIQKRKEKATDISGHYKTSIKGVKMSRSEAADALERAKEEEKDKGGIPDIKGELRREIRKAIGPKPKIR